MTEKRFLYLGLVFAMFVCAVAARAGDGLVALQTADPSCPDDSGNVYVDCGNGTVTDNRTGLVWLKNADCFGELDWFGAMALIAGLGDLDCSVSEGEGCDCGLSDGSSPGEWRLPSRKQWQAMVADAVALGCVFGEYGGPSITDDSGGSCWQEGPGNSFTGVQLSSYWSSSTNLTLPDSVFRMWLPEAYLGTSSKTFTHYIWPARGGQ